MHIPASESKGFSITSKIGGILILIGLIGCLFFGIRSLYVTMVGVLLFFYGIEGIDPSNDKRTKKVKDSDAWFAIITTFVFVALSIGGIEYFKPSKKSSISTQQTGESNYTESPNIRNSNWDGGVYQVKQYIKQNAHDPDSIEFVEWSPVQKLPNGSKVRCKYRGKNAFGASVIIPLS